MPTTEIAIIPLTPGSKAGDPSNPAASIVNESFDTIKKQDGQREFFFGMQHEHPEVMQLFIDWDTVDKHKEFMSSEAYGPFMKNIGQIVGGAPNIFHVNFQPEGKHHSDAFSAPVTEVATFYYDGAPASGYLDGVIQWGQKLAKANTAGYRGLAIGTTHEEQEYEGVKGTAVVALIGWDSVESHMEFRTTEEFKENIHILRGDAKKIEMHHVQVMNAV